MHPTVREIQKADLRKVPDLKTGYTVKVSQKVTEGSKERVQNFEGLIIKVSHGTDNEKTFTVRKIVEGIGVEKIFPFHSPNITKIRVVKKAKVRREKLYYMRERFGKSARLSEKHVTDEERAAEEKKMEALYSEAIKADEKRKKEEEATPDGGQAATPVDEAAPAPEAEEKVEEKAEDKPLDESAEVGEATEDSTDEKAEEAPVEEEPEEELKEDDTAEEKS